jgi:hypothetical protein
MMWHRLRTGSPLTFKKSASDWLLGHEPIKGAKRHPGRRAAKTAWTWRIMNAIGQTKAPFKMILAAKSTKAG